MGDSVLPKETIGVVVQSLLYITITHQHDVFAHLFSVTFMSRTLLNIA